MHLINNLNKGIEMLVFFIVILVIIAVITCIHVFEEIDSNNQHIALLNIKIGIVKDCNYLSNEEKEQVIIDLTKAINQYGKGV